jgi:hypothetical protein
MCKCMVSNSAEETNTVNITDPAEFSSVIPLGQNKNLENVFLCSGYKQVSLYAVTTLDIIHYLRYG